MTKPDLTEFFKHSRPKKPPCKVAFVLEQLDSEEREQLAAALTTDAGLITTGAIVAWASARGHDLSIPAITSHRQGKCRCNDDA